LGPSARPSAPEQPDSRPQSPFTAYRELVQHLTLPSVPNLDIPPSPPGSPPPGVDAKMQHFLELKRGGIHFNEKLASSSALKNSGLLGKLMANAGLDRSEQYLASLPKEVWDTTCFPAWAYSTALRELQKEAEKQRQEVIARKGRVQIDFVPPSHPL
jgi:HCNGP-like protein